jgi:hypothetical protein
MALLPMANNDTGVPNATAAVETIHNLAATARRKKNKLWSSVKSALRLAVWSTSSAFLAKISLSGSKKEDTLPDLSATLLEPDSLEASVLELDELWLFVLKRTVSAGFESLYAEPRGEWMLIQ